MPNDPVNHPKHYTRDGAMECFDEMRMIFGDKATACYCLLAAWKYRYRAADKNGAEDIAKSDWYMRRYSELTKNSHIEIETDPDYLNIPF